MRASLSGSTRRSAERLTDVRGVWLSGRVTEVPRAVRGDHALVMREIRVAFFRNLNLGQARSHSPTSGQLLDAFVAAGARSPSHVGANGTVVYYYPQGRPWRVGS